MSKKYEPITIDEATIAALEEKHDDVLILKGDPEMSPWLVVVRRPTRQETLGYKSHAKKDQTTANEQLIKRIAVFPVGDDMDRQLARWPFLPDGIADDDKFKRFMGLSVEASLK
jgi:hypothetical protein